MAIPETKSYLANGSHLVETKGQIKLPVRHWEGLGTPPTVSPDKVCLTWNTRNTLQLRKLILCGRHKEKGVNY